MHLIFQCLRQFCSCGGGAIANTTLATTRSTLNLYCLYRLIQCDAGRCTFCFADGLLAVEYTLIFFFSQQQIEEKRKRK